MVFYEAPHKLNATLRDMLAVWGDRDISLSRELTKLHEETLRTTLEGAVRHFAEHAPRGEFVLVIGGAAPEDAPRIAPEDALALVAQYRADGMTLREAAKKVSDETGIAKNALYAAAVGDSK